MPNDDDVETILRLLEGVVAQYVATAAEKEQLRLTRNSLIAQARKAGVSADDVAKLARVSKILVYKITSEIT